MVTSVAKTQQITGVQVIRPEKEYELRLGQLYLRGEKVEEISLHNGETFRVKAQTGGHMAETAEFDRKGTSEWIQMLNVQTVPPPQGDQHGSKTFTFKALVRSCGNDLQGSYVHGTLSLKTRPFDPTFGRTLQIPVSVWTGPVALRA